MSGFPQTAKKWISVNELSSKLDDRNPILVLGGGNCRGYPVRQRAVALLAASLLPLFLPPACCGYFCRPLASGVNRIPQT